MIAGKTNTGSERFKWPPEAVALMIDTLSLDGEDFALSAGQFESALLGGALDLTFVASSTVLIGRQSAAADDDIDRRPWHMTISRDCCHVRSWMSPRRCGPQVSHRQAGQKISARAPGRLLKIRKHSFLRLMHRL